MEAAQSPLSNMQLELLKLFSRDLAEEDVVAIKRLIVEYLSEKLERIADEVWEKKGWTNEDMDAFLEMHLRTPYKT